VNVPPDGSSATRTRATGPVLALLGVVALCTAVVVLLGAAVRTDFGPLRDLDGTVSEALYAGDHRARALDVLLQILTAPGLAVVRYVVAVPLMIWLARRGARRSLIWVVVTFLTMSPLTSALKDLFGRVRPDFHEGGARYTTLSFPSGHSSGIATLATVGLLLAWPLLGPAARRLWAALAVLLVLLVGLTRMWLGVHFLSDVVAGWALGLGWTLLVGVVLGVLPTRRGELR
jgi:membrane-associated phospholipid phosphatase